MQAAVRLSGRPLAIALCAMYGALSLFFCWPLFQHPQALGTNDWDQHLFYYGVVLKNVVEYGQMPFWNPWYCGGNVMWQNPQIAVLSPVYPLAMIMSLPLAMKVNVVLHYWIGFIGMHLLLTRVIGLTFLPAVIYLATLVTASGAPAIHLRVGHSVFLPGFYLPLQLYFFFKAFKTGEWRYICLSAATLALMVFNGGTHILPMSIAGIGCFALVVAIAKRDWKPLAFAAAFGLAGLAYSAPKLLPVIEYVNGEYFWDTRNPTEHPDRATIDILKQTYLVPTQDVTSRLPLQRHGWHEYGNYIGLFSAVLLLGSLLEAFRSRSAHDYWFGLGLAVTTVFMFLLSLGEFNGFAPASLAHYVPLFSSFRIPSRYTIPCLQFAALTSGWLMQRTSERTGPTRRAKAVVGIVLFVTAGSVMLNNQWNLKNVFTLEPFDTRFTWNGGPHQLTTDTSSSAYTPDSPMLHALVSDRSFFNCYESLQLSRGAVADKAPVFDPNSDRVTDLDFTPNQLTFTVKDGIGPAEVLLNQNWGPGWTSSAGAITPPPKTELARITVPAGRYRFSFVPPGFYSGLAIFAVALIATAFVWRRKLAAIS